MALTETTNTIQNAFSKAVDFTSHHKLGLGAVVTLGGVVILGKFLSRKSTYKFQIDKVIPAIPRDVYEFLKEPTNYYSIGRKGYVPVVRKRTDNEIYYILEDYALGKKITTDVVVHYYDEDPLYLKIECRDDLMHSYMQLNYRFYPYGDDSTKVSLDWMAEGPLWASILYRPAKIELGFKFNRLKEVFESKKNA